MLLFLPGVTVDAGRQGFEIIWHKSSDWSDHLY